MYHYWSFKGIDALVSAGLGGGSLIYANVFIRKDENWFVQEDLVRRRLRVLAGQPRRPRPALRPRRADDRPAAVSRSTTSRTPRRRRRSPSRRRPRPTASSGSCPKLAVTFANEGRPPVPGEAIVEEIPNLHGRTRTTCQMCGECDVGCNYGAKNTLDYNYLTHAKHHGAEIRTLADVRRIEPAANGGGYERQVRRPGRAPRRTRRPYELTCDHLILSAGTLGTTNLLLKNRSAFPRPLAQARQPLLRQRRPADAGAQHDARSPTACATPRIVDPGYGPVITSTARMPDALRPAAPGAASTSRTPATRSTWRGSCTSIVGAASSSGAGARARRYLVKNWLRGHAGHRRHRPDRRPDAAGRAVRRRPAAARHGPRRPGRADVPAQRPARHRLAQGVGLGRVLQPPAQHVARLRHRARRSLRGQPAVVPQARDHRPPARRRADGPPRGRGRRGRLRQRVRPPRPAHRRRLGDARPDRARTPASRSRRWPTASPTRSSIPTDAPRRRRPHDLKRSLHRGDARARHVRRARLRPRRPAEPRRVGGVQVPPHDRGRRHRGLRQRPAAARDRRRLGRVRRARRQAAGRAAAGSTCSSTSSRASSTCSTGCGSATASATR